MPSRLATSQIVSPSAAVTDFPSRVNVICFVISKIIPEMRQQVVYWIGRSLAKSANGRVTHDHFKVAYRGVVGRALLPRAGSPFFQSLRGKACIGRNSHA